MRSSKHDAMLSLGNLTVAKLLAHIKATNTTRIEMSDTEKQIHFKLGKRSIIEQIESIIENEEV